MRILYTILISFLLISSGNAQVLQTKTSCANPIPIDFTVTITSNYNGQAISCNGFCDGEITVTVNSAGGGPYGFQLFDGTSTITQAATVPGGGTSTIYSGLCADNFNVTVFDSSQVIFGTIFESCTEFGIILSNPNNIGVNVLGFQDPTCPDSCDGRIFANIGGGTAPLDILWLESGSTVSSPSGVCTGDNTVEVTDANLCFFTTIVTVNDPININFGMTIQDVSCDGVCDAQAASSPSGSNGGPFDFTWTQLPGGATIGSAAGVPNFTQGSLCENVSYQLFLEDVNGCPFDTTITISDVLPMTLTEVSTQDASCANTCDGQMTISIAGGSGNYTQIEWFEGLIGAGVPFAAGPSLSEVTLCPNTDYYVTVTDDQGCTNDFQLSQIQAPPAFNFSETHTDVTCANDQDGSIDITLSGGTPNYVFTWTSVDGVGFNANTPDQTNISGGTYHLVWVDDNLCTDSVDIVILEPEEIYTNGIVTDVSCFDLTDGSIDVTTTGGNGTYTWTWTATPNGVASLVDPTLEDQSSLDSAIYSLHIVDLLGCTYDTTFNLVKPGEIFYNAVVTPMDCFGDNDAVIDLFPNNGVPNYIIDWGSPINQNNGPTSQSNLSANTYDITITDANGCDKDTSIVITEPVLLTASETHQTITCFGDGDGSIDVTIGGGTAPVTIVWVVSGGGTPIGGTSTTNPTNLSPGTYEATVEDANGCQVILTVDITEPNPLSLTATGIDLTCNGIPNGGVTLSNITGGTVAGSYLFDWDNDGSGDFDDTQDLAGLLAGTYCVNIEDDNGCRLALDSCVTIIEPDSIFFNGSFHTDITCNGDDDGTTNLTVTGGTEAGFYDFLWNPVPACYGGSTIIQDLSSLCAGTYTVTATDDNGCTNDTTFTIVEPLPLTISESHINLTCEGVDAGEIQITVTGGVVPTTVTWVSTSTVTPAVDDLNPTGLPPGTYTATVTDNNACTDVVIIDITEPLPLSLTITGADLTCNGVPDGTVSIVPTGGTVVGVYTFDWDNDGTGDFDDNQNLSGLLAGTYCVNFMDDNGCTLVADSCFTIIEPDSIFFDGSFHTDITCNGDDDGEIDLTVTGGTEAGFYDFNWNVVPGCYGGSTLLEDLSGLCDGTYTVIVTDDNGCTNDTTFTIVEPLALSIITSHIDAGCGVSNGEVTVTPSGGTVAGNYTISWFNSGGGLVGSNLTETGLAPDTYDVTVTDDNGCSVSGQEIVTTITPPTITTDNVTDLLCNSVCSGSISTTVSGGVAPYVIDWTAANDATYTNSTDDIFSLCADDYTITVTDANLCQQIVAITVAEPAAIEVVSSSVTNVDCFGNASGAIDMTVQGGTVAGAYGFTWTGDNSFSSTNEDVSGLLPGNYCFNFTDDNGCSLAADSCYVITEPTELVIDLLTSTDAQCNVPTGSVSVSASGGTIALDYTYNWVDLATNFEGATATVNNLINDTYTVTVTDDNGCTVTGSVSVQPTNGPAVSIDNVIDVTCFGASNGAISTSGSGGTGALTFTWASIPAGFVDPGTPDISGIPGGTYVVTVTDGALCNTQDVVVVNEPSDITFLSAVTDANCFGENGDIDITVSGGTVAGTYSYDWDDNGTGAFIDAEDLSAPAGTYNVIVSDDNGCTATAGPFTINEPTEITLVTSSTQSSCLLDNGSVSVVAANGTPGTAPNEYTYVWTDNSTGLQVGNAAMASNLDAGCYDVLVTENRINGCTSSTTECVSDINGPTLTETPTDPSCFDGLDGEILLDVVSPVGGVTFVWTALNGSVISPNNTSEDINGLAEDDYSVVATDGNGCVTGLSIALTEPAEMDIIATLQNPTCASSLDGSITITTINNAALPIASTTWSGPNAFSAITQDISGLEAGQYCLTLIDANACQLDTCITLTAPVGITLITSATDTDCSAPTGQVTGSAVGGVPTYTFDWTGNGGPYSGNVISGLDVGTYTLTVTDLNGCTASTTQDVAASNAPTVSVTSVNDADCFGNSSGDIFVTVSGGTPNYTYDWDNDGTGDNDDSEDLTGIPAGTYTLTVTDNAGCSAVPVSATVGQPAAPLDIVGVTNDLICNAGGTGQIDITVTGGTANYTYDWTESGSLISTTTNGTGLNSLSGLDALTYDVLVTDANGCTVTDSYTLIEPTAVTLVMGNIDASCGNSDGEVSVVASGGTDGISYTYSWIDFTTGLPLAGGNAATVTGLAQGTFEVTVTDLNGCQATDLATVSDIGGPTVTSGSTPVLCFGDANGTIDITITGNPNFVIGWTGPNAFTSSQEDLTGLEAGNYAVAVTDVNSCVTNQIVTVSGPSAPLAVVGTITDLSCFNNATGAVDITISGGTSNYVATWSSILGFSAVQEDISSLAADTYTVDITDANGCTLNGTDFIVAEPNDIVITETIVDPSCGLSDGSVSVIVTGGTVAADYTYVWTDVTAGAIMPDVDADIAGIDAGNYQVDITDDNGCTSTLAVAVSNDQAPPLTVVQTDIDCNGNSTGAIDITVNGVNTYTYDWDIDGTGDFDDTEDLSGLSVGTYNLEVLEDPTGCISSATVTLTEPDVLALSSNLSDLLCFGDGSGILDITVTGGTLNYFFDWDNDGTGDNDDTEDLSGVSAGTYVVTVTDANNCQIVDSYTIIEPLEINITAVVTDNICNGDAFGAIDVTVADGVLPYIYSWDTPSANEDETLLAAGFYTFTVTDDNGCSKDSIFEITEPAPFVYSAVVTDATCTFSDGAINTTVSGGTLTSPDYTYDWVFGGSSIATTASIVGQPAGTYVFFVTDDNGCSGDTTVVINNTNAPTITLDNITDVSCFGFTDGAIDVSISGGAAPYTYVWNPNGISQTEDLSNAPADTYSIQVTDALGCISTLTNLTIASPTELTASITSTDATCGICNGEAIAAGSGGSGSYNYLWSSGTGIDTETGLCAGLYSVQVSDNAGCVTNGDVAISDIGGPTGETLITTDVSCASGSDGTADITAIGGTAPYNYFWPHNGSTNNVQSTLSAGSFFVEMSDANGCIRVVPVDIQEPMDIIVSSVINPSTCGNSDGDITITTSGGSSPLTINWLTAPVTGQTTPGVSGLPAGIYSVQVTDNNGCTVTNNFTISDINAPTVTLTPTDVLCNGDATGNITSSVTGAVGVLGYQWYDATPSSLAGETNADILTQPIGTYTLEVTDAGTGCIALTSATIDEPDAMTVSLPNLNDAGCASACDGSATVVVSGGTLNYTYLWDGGQTSQTATGLCVGVNNVTVTDANGCALQTSLIIDYTELLVSSVTPTDAACGLCDGQAVVTPSGGSGNYTITWYDNTTGTSHIDLCAGIYPYTVTDNVNGCQTDLDVTINNIGGPDSETITVTDATCFGGSDGSATVSPSGGTAPYQFLWVPTGVTSSTLSNVGAGTYNLEVSDANGCIRVVPVTIGEGSELDLQYVSTGPNCGSSDGSISLITSGGVAPYLYSWSGPGGFSSVNQDETGLAAGLYTITITDNGGCSQVFQIPLTSTTPPVVSVTTTDITCFGAADGTATAVGVNQSYVWSDASVTANIGSLSAGTYFVTATDLTTGCVNIASGIVDEPESLTFGVHNVIDPLCFGDCNGEVSAIVDGGTLPYTYTWSTAGGTSATESNLCDGITTLTLTDQNGCILSEDITLTQPTVVLITIDNITDATCVNSQDGAIDITSSGGTGTISYSWVTSPSSSFSSTNEDLSGLDPTFYEVTATDANGCTAVELIPVDTLFIVLAHAGPDTAFCFNNCAILQGSATAPGAVSYEWNSVPTTVVLSTADTLESCPSVVGILQYTLTVSDANCSHTDTINVELYPLPTADAGADIEDVLSTTVTLGGSPTGPTGSSYYWTPNTNFLSINDTSTSNPDIELLTEMDYYVFVTDTNGCMNSDTIHVRPIPQIVFPNGFTPNGDGINDDWQIDYIDQFPESSVEVYNRWGEQLFISIGYTERWDGTYEGNPLPVGTYYYIIELNDPLFPETYSGPITIMR